MELIYIFLPKFCHCRQSKAMFSKQIRIQ